MKKSFTDIKLVKGSLPKKQKLTYHWETTPKRQLEPWHLSTVALCLDIVVLYVYMFVNFSKSQLLFIGYMSHLLSLFTIIGAYWLLKSSKKKWSQPILKFSRMINTVAFFITVVITILTISLT